MQDNGTEVSTRVANGAAGRNDRETLREDEAQTDVDRVIAQLDELAETRLRSRARELRHQIEQEIATLVQSWQQEAPREPAGAVSGSSN